MRHGCKPSARRRPEIEARAAQRFAREQADYEAKVKAREEQGERTGKKPRGTPPAPPTPGPRTEDQVNLTDPDSRIMPTAGFEQSYNAQAAVDTDTMLVVATGLTQAPKDKQQITPMVETLGALPEALGEIARRAMEGRRPRRGARDSRPLDGRRRVIERRHARAIATWCA